MRFSFSFSRLLKFEIRKKWPKDVRTDKKKVEQPQDRRKLMNCQDVKKYLMESLL